MMRLGNLLLLCFVLGSNATEYLRAQYGTFSSPNYPDEYGNNLRKEWIIQVRSGYHVELRFTAFDLEDSYEENQGACVYDYVSIMEGSKKIARLCGNQKSSPWDAPKPHQTFTSNGNETTVLFVSDYSNENISPTGFFANYVEEDNDECVKMTLDRQHVLEDWDELIYCDHFCNNVPGSYYCSCRNGYELHTNKHTCVAITNCVDEELTSDEGIIESPAYPHPYAKLSHCTWDIKVRDGLLVHLTFDDEFGVEDHVNEGCVYDILEISHNGMDEKYCGTTAPNNGSIMDMDTKNVKIDFRTDLSVEMKGFRIFYNTSRVRCHHPLSSPTNGTIVTKNPKGYYEFEDLVQFRCDRGYDLIGSSILECLSDGNWDHEQPMCKIKSCGRPDHLIAVGNSHIINLGSKKFEYLEKVTVECNEWYEMISGAATWRCEDSKKWVNESALAHNNQKDIPICRPKCGMRLVPEDAFEEQLLGAKKVKKHGGFPWMAFVDLGGGRFGTDYCGGTLVDEKTVVTAAHCVYPIDDDEDVHVWLGMLNRTADNFNFTQHFVVPSEKRYVEGSYSAGGESFDGDIAVLKLDKPVNLSYYVHPICVPNPAVQNRILRKYKIDRTNFVVTGWGDVGGKNYSEVLMKTRVGFVNLDTCRQRYDEELGRRDLITDNMICAGFDNSENDACKGDSGGPLMSKEERSPGTFIWYLSGVVSFGDEKNRDGCVKSKAYGVYTDVSKYEGFVRANMEVL